MSAFSFAMFDYQRFVCLKIEGIANPLVLHDVYLQYAPQWQETQMLYLLFAYIPCQKRGEQGEVSKFIPCLNLKIFDNSNV